MGRAPCCRGEHGGLKKGPWTDEEDQKLKSFLLNNPGTSWRQVPRRAGLLRCGKSCRLRWMNYLRPDIRRGNFTAEEESTIIQLHAAVGNKWAVIASQLPGRTDNEIKNLWNTKLKKNLVCKGINPITHQPFCNTTLYSYLDKCIKSIENAIITGIMTNTSSPLTTPAITNSGNSHITSHSLDVLLQSFMSLQSNSISESSVTKGNTQVDDFLMMNRTDFISSNPNEFGDDTSNPFSAVDIDTVAANGPITLEEGMEYWN